MVRVDSGEMNYHERECSHDDAACVNLPFAPCARVLPSRLSRTAVPLTPRASPVPSLCHLSLLEVSSTSLRLTTINMPALPPLSQHHLPQTSDSAWMIQFVRKTAALAFIPRRFVRLEWQALKHKAHPPDDPVMQGPPMLRNPCCNLADLCLETLESKIRGCKVVYLTTYLREVVSVEISTSDLRMGTGTEDHFDTMSLKTLITDEVNRNTLVDNIMRFVKEQKQILLTRRGILPAIKQCKADVFKKYLLKTGIRNEDELRFSIVDPIVVLLCEFWGLKVRVCACVPIIINTQMPKIDTRC